MVRNAVMLLGDADLRIRALAQFARHHEGKHARHVRLLGSRDQRSNIEPDVFVEGVRHADRRVERWPHPYGCCVPSAECAARSRERCRGNH